MLRVVVPVNMQCDIEVLVRLGRAGRARNLREDTSDAEKKLNVRRSREIVKWSDCTKNGSSQF